MCVSLSLLPLLPRWRWGQRVSKQTELETCGCCLDRAGSGQAAVTHRLLLVQPGPPSLGLGLELLVQGGARPSEAPGAAGERRARGLRSTHHSCCEVFVRVFFLVPKFKTGVEGRVVTERG